MRTEVGQLHTQLQAEHIMLNKRMSAPCVLPGGFTMLNALALDPYRRQRENTDIKEASPRMTIYYGQ